jgi:hypothetical protein
VDAAGNETYSNKVMAEIRDVIPPKAPQNFKTAASSGKIKLTWSGNSETDLKGYHVQRSLKESKSGDNSFININKKPIIGNVWEEELPKNIRNKVVYRVVAVDTSLNRSKPSNTSLAQMPDVVGPRTPRIKTVVYNENIEITWVPSAEVDLAGYNVYQKSVKDSTDWEHVNIN